MPICDNISVVLVDSIYQSSQSDVFGRHIILSFTPASYDEIRTMEFCMQVADVCIGDAFWRVHKAWRA